MSLLNAMPQPIPPADRLAAAFREHARNTYQQLIRTFNGTAQEFWRNSQATPQEIAAALGTDAVEVFQLHAKIGALIADVDPTTIAAGLAVVGEFVYNEDGTVEIVITPPTESDSLVDLTDPQPEEVPPPVVPDEPVTE